MKNIAFSSERHFSVEKLDERDLLKNVAKIDNEYFLPIKAQSEEAARQDAKFFDSADQQVFPHDLLDDAALANCEPCCHGNALANEFGQEGENAHLQEYLTAALVRVSELEREITTNSLMIDQRDTEIADLYNKQNQQGIETHGACHEEYRLRELITAICEKITQLESETNAAKEQCILAEDETLTLRAQLDAALHNAAESSKGFFDFEAAFIDREADIKSARAQIEQMQAAYSTITQETNRLATEIAQAERGHYRDLNELRAYFEKQINQMEADNKSARAQIEQMQAASSTTEEENNSLKATMAETERQHSHELNEQRVHFENHISQMEISAQVRDRTIKDLEHVRSKLLEHYYNLIAIVFKSAKEYVRGELSSKNKSIECLESQLTAEREAAERKINGLISELQRERLNRSAAPNTSEALRKELACLLPKLVAQRNPTSAPELAAAIHHKNAA